MARLFGAVAVMLMLSGVLAVPASAGQLAITSFTGDSTLISHTGGTVSLLAFVQGTTTCTFSVSPALVGLPTSIGCQNGSASQQVSIPANTGKARSFTFTVRATTGKTSVTKTLIVNQANALEVVGLSAGNNHTCALVKGATVKCWGANNYSQLGLAASTYIATPVAISGLTGVKSISAGGEHTCALDNGGIVRCWGGNESGQLGDGTQNDAATPVTVTGLAGVKAISAGDLHTCALLTAGTVKCWGYN